MSEPGLAAPPLEAKSEFELRVKLSENLPVTDIRGALASGSMGFLHSFTTGSAVDGPGIRVVAWTASCMFRCKFCHNPDTWALTNGLPVPIERATETLAKYANGLKVMRGGFTLSGGEPLMQDRFAARMFAAAKRMGVHTAIETNGFYSDRMSDVELRDIDLVILDMKAFHPDQHLKVTGIASNTKVLDFARRLAAMRRPMWMRHVLVPGLTDIPAELEALAEFVGSLGVVERVEILPFHQMGRYKWERLGLDYTLAQTEPPSVASVQRAIDIFKAAGLDAC